jgi:putative ABC transport system permease protein
VYKRQNEIREQPGIADAEAGSIIVSRIEKKPGKWVPLLLFTVKDFNGIRLNKFALESGTWPPPKGSLLLERQSLPIINAKKGSRFTVQTPNGSPKTVSVAGVVHDPGLAPSWMEQTAYGYITVDTQSWLGEGSSLRNVKIKTDKPLDDLSIEKTVTGLATWLNKQGNAVGEIRIPPSGKHPHQSQMTGILTMLLIFSIMALALGAVLTSTMISGILARQIRQIGVIKAIGGSTFQIVILYGALVALLSIVSFVIGLPPGVLAGRAFADVISSLLNFTLYSKAVPAWAYLIQFAVGISIPLIAAMYPILRVSKTTVREAINDFGVSRKMFGSGRFDRFLTGLQQITRLNSSTVMALRNTFRRKGRLAFTLVLLVAAGSMFATGLNVKTAWEEYVTSAAANRHYDVEFRFNKPEPAKKVFSIVSSVKGVQKVESWSVAPAALSRADGLDVVRTYPDGGHGSFSVRLYPIGSKMLDQKIVSGRKLSGDEPDTVVLNNTTKTFLPDAKVGDTIKLMVNGRNVSLRVVGLTREILTPPTAYVSTGTFSSFSGSMKPNNTVKTGLAATLGSRTKSEKLSQTPIASTDFMTLPVGSNNHKAAPGGQLNVIRIVTDKHDNTSRNRIAAEIEKALAKESISIRTVITEEMLDGAITGHVYIFVFALMLMAAIMAVVGVLGLASTMSTNVIERTREFGVMRTIGGRSKTVLHSVTFEGTLIGLMSWAIAILLSMPLSLFVGNFIGNMAFRSELPLTISTTGVFTWLALILIGSIVASGYPAKKASRLTVRETLAYV